MRYSVYTQQRKVHTMPAPVYVTRPRPTIPWGDAGDIRLALEAAGFRHSELMAHIADLDAGHVLTTEDGREFRREVVSDNHPTVDLPAMLEGPRVPTTYRVDVPEDACTVCGYGPHGPVPGGHAYTTAPMAEVLARRPGRPAVGPLRSVRVSDEVWAAAAAAAEARGESVSEVIRAALIAYALDPGASTLTVRR